MSDMMYRRYRMNEILTILLCFEFMSSFSGEYVAGGHLVSCRVLLKDDWSARRAVEMFHRCCV